MENQLVQLEEAQSTFFGQIGLEARSDSRTENSGLLGSWNEKFPKTQKSNWARKPKTKQNQMSSEKKKKKFQVENTEWTRKKNETPPIRKAWEYTNRRRRRHPRPTLWGSHISCVHHCFLLPFCRDTNDSLLLLFLVLRLLDCSTLSLFSKRTNRTRNENSCLFLSNVLFE